jgi:hypothetical protein
MPQLRITSHRNNSPLSGWLGLGLALLCFLLAHFGPVSAREQLVLRIIGLVFLVIGLAVLLWSPRRITTINAEARRISIENVSRFGARKRSIPFDLVAEVVVHEWEDPDPDIRPMKRTLYGVALHLQSGELVEITDQASAPEGAQEIRSQVTAQLHC